MTASPTQKRRLGESLDVPEDVLADAVAFYRDLHGEQLDGIPEDVVPIAVLYIAVRQHGLARSIDEMASVAAVSSVSLYRAARRVSNVLDEGIPPVEPEVHVARLVDRFDLDPAIEEDAFETLAAAKADGYHVGKKPPGVAAAAVYAVLDVRDGNPAVTQRELSETTGVHIKTVRKNYQGIRPFTPTDHP